MNKNFIIGGGGFASEVHSLLIQENIKIDGYFDVSKKSNLNLPYMGPDEAIKDHKISDSNFYLCIGNIKKRISITNRIPQLNFSSFISKDSNIFNSKVGVGSIIYPGCTIINSSIGNFTLINAGATLGHDVEIGNFCNINPGCNIGGCVKILNESFIGIGSTIKEKITINCNSLIGAHSNVTKNTVKYSLYYGNPARKIPQK